MNFFIFIIMKAICIQSTFNKCTILTTTDLQQINVSHLDHQNQILQETAEGRKLYQKCIKYVISEN